MVGKKKLVFAALFLLYIPFTVTAKYNHSCPASSCGNITDIRYPFRLKSDPPNCGDAYYQLLCDNNQNLVLELFSGKYYVNDINYTDYTIRVADVGVQQGNCSSFPLHSLGQANFSSGGNIFWLLYEDSLTVISCETPHKSPLYVDAAGFCIAQTSSKKYRYVVLGDKASNVGNSCDLDLIYPTRPAPNKHGNTTYVYVDIHNDLNHGFVLYWNSYNCAECSGQGSCQYNDTIFTVQCTSPCSLKHITSFQCLFNLVFIQGMGLILSIIYVAIVFPIVLNLFSAFEIFVAARFVCGAVCLVIFLIYKWKRSHLSMYNSIEEFLQNQNNLMPIRYSYSEIKKMTNNFKVKLGKGGYGSVYKGKVRSGYLVAVKILEESKATGQEFINEVATIGRIHHVNVVRLIGFCAEGSKRALVYDFMPNGSLDKYVFSREGYAALKWEQMYDISLGVARGLEYLHRGCDMQILHFDIKPHNILLDENFIPKVSDFGLARLYSTNDSIVSLTAARGTIGYIAPELFYKNIGRISYKADVYSFGMLLMEMTGKRNNSNPAAEHSSQVYFPFWVHDQIAREKEIETEGTDDEEKKIAQKMVIVALWCIQMNPTNRPSMNIVVEMLEGELDSLELPPKPTFYPEESLQRNIGEDSSQASSDDDEFTESSSLITSITTCELKHI